MPLGVDLLEAHVVDPELLRPALRDGRASRARSPSRSACRRAGSARRRGGRCRRARGDLEHRLAGLGVDGVDHPAPRRASWPPQRVAARAQPAAARPSAPGSARGSPRRPPSPRTLAQVAPPDLAGLRARERGDELEGLGHLVRREPGGAVRCSWLASTRTPARGTTSAVTASPHSASARAKTAASATAGWAASTASTSAGATFSPPVTIMSPLRPVTTSRPSGSSRPRSPVRRLPSAAHRRAGDEDLAVGGDGHADAGQRAAGRLEVARLGDGDRASRPA